MEFVIIGVVGAVIVGLIAKQRGREIAPWLIYGLFIWPVALIHLLVLSDQSRKCPFCAESIKAEANTCRFCGRDVPAIEGVSPEEKIYNYLDKKIYLHRNRSASIEGVDKIFPGVREATEYLDAAKEPLQRVAN